MSSPKRKTSQQTISISPELKRRIEEYVMINHENHPNDKRFRSVSSFYTSVMEKTLDCFDKGKTLDDFESFVDSEVKDFFEKLSFNALIPYYENTVKTSRYTSQTFEEIPFLYLTLKKFFMPKIDTYDVTTIKTLFNRVRNYIFSNSISKEFKLDLFTGKSRTDLTGVFEYVGLFKNLSFETCKYTVMFFGFLGVKVTNLIYSDKEIYYRLDLEVTDLFFRKGLAKRERIKLVNDNISYLVNYLKIINDNDYYLWMEMAKDKNVIISFNNEEVKRDWVNLIESEIEKFGEKDDYILNMLRLFERFHWIEIENAKNLIFHIRLSKMKYQNEIEFLLNTLSKYSSIKEANGKHYLKK